MYCTKVYEIETQATQQEHTWDCPREFLHIECCTYVVVLHVPVLHIYFTSWLNSSSHKFNR